MNAYRFAREQRKPVATFHHDGSVDASGNRIIAEKVSNLDAIFSLHYEAAKYDKWLRKVLSST
jgi:hypothetical protein